MEDWASSTLIIHGFTDIPSWPPELAQITAQLARPLTAIPNVPPEYLSPNALEMYDELTKLSQISVSEEIDSELPTQVSNVLDTILTSVKMLRDLSRSASHAGTPQPTLPVWRHLLGVLSLACCKDAEILTDVPFLLPRTMPLAIELSEKLSFEGQASLLVALYIGPKEYVTDAMEVDGTVSSTKDSSGTTASKTSFIPLPGPIDGHILPGCGKRVDCVLPIICVADQDNIRALVTSTVYQKYCWGISLPTIGISIDQSSTVARIYIGWIDTKQGYECPLKYQLPPVHLAFSCTSRQTDSSSGAFDLLNPLSALQFARFIIATHAQISSIAAELDAPHIQDLCWRLDHVVLTTATSDFHSDPEVDDRRERILQWAHNVTPPDSSEDDNASVILPSYTSSTGSVGKTRASAGDSNKQGDSKASEHNSDAKTSGSIKVSKNASSEAKNSLSEKLSGYSASRFAAENDTLWDDQVGTDHWLWERSTLRLCRIQTYGDSKAEQHMNKMLDIYNSTFALAWPENWQKMGPPSCDPICRDVLDRLLTQYDEYSKQELKGIAGLDERTASFLESRMSIFLSTVAVSSHHAQRGEQRLNTNEAERIHPIDLLIQSFCCSENMLVSDSFFLKLMLRLSKDKAVHEGIQDHEQSMLWSFLATRQQEAISYKQDPHLFAVAVEVQKQAVSKLVGLPSSPYKHQLDVTSRLHEPSDVTADSVMCTRLPVTQAACQLPSSRVTWSMILRRDISGLKTRSNVTKSNTFTGSTQGISKQATHPDCKMCPFVPGAPFLFAQYKRNYDDIQKSFRQCQLCVVSAVDYLATLGIKDFPIFGIVATGAKASVMMAWRCSERLNRSAANRDQDACHDINIIIDQNLVSFNLAEPLDCYRFAIALHRIYERRQRLEELLGEIKDLERKLQSPEKVEDRVTGPTGRKEG